MSVRTVLRSRLAGKQNNDDGVNSPARLKMKPVCCVRVDSWCSNEMYELLKAMRSGYQTGEELCVLLHNYRGQ